LNKSKTIDLVVETKDYSDGYVKVLDHVLFFKTWGELGEKGTVLCLHGGPGTSSDPSSNMAKLTEHGYKVVAYDQLGCGRSERPQDRSLYNVDRFAEEVEGIRQALNLGKIHLFGGSWGGMLNVAYAVKYSKNLKSLIISSGSSSTPLDMSELKRMRAALPKKVRVTLETYEQTGDTKNPEYLKARKFWMKKHFYRAEPWPMELNLLFAHGPSANPNNIARDVMWGNHPFLPTGNLLHWDVTDKLGNITVPTLIMCGEYDYVSPECSKLLHKNIKGSKLVIFENCGHALQRQEPEKYIKTIADFLDDVNQNS
jgi:proline iminopeptidase